MSCRIIRWREPVVGVGRGFRGECGDACAVWCGIVFVECCGALWHERWSGRAGD